MQTYAIHRLSDFGELPSAPRSVALGLFDGIHIGHRAVLSQTLDWDDGAVPCVFTFSGSPAALPKRTPALLSEANKQLLMERIGLSEMLDVDFDCIRDLSPEAFVRDILHHTLHAVRVCCGENFRFGKGGVGDVRLLRTLCEAELIDLRVIGTVECDGVPVSSTRIRQAIQAGDFPLATRLLGHPFWIDEVVSKGQQLGRTLGFPTLNQCWPEGFIQPRFGVYLSAVEIDGCVHTGLTNIGRHPTVGSTAPLAETFVPDYDGDLYGKAVRTVPVRFLREEQTFDGVEALRAQLCRDAEAARNSIRPTGKVRAILFDFDDTLQARPAAYRRYANRFVHRHFSHLPQEVREARAEEMWEKNGRGHACVGAGRYIPYDRYFEELIAEWKWDNAPTTDELTAECRTMLASETSLFPDAMSTLKALREKGYAIGAITNGFSAMQGRKLDISGLRPLLDITVVSGDEGVRKPNPEIFYRAAARLGFAPEDCLYVGDHPYYDIQGAEAAGFRSVLIDAFERGFEPEGVPVIKSLSDLLNVL